MISQAVYILLAVFLGGIGIHKFYSRHWVQGILYMLFCWTFIPCILALLQAFGVLCTDKDVFNKNYNGDCV